MTEIIAKNRKDYKLQRNSSIYQEVKKYSPDIPWGVFNELSKKYGVSRERIRKIFRAEEVRRGDVFHKLLNGRMVSLKILANKKAGN